MKEKLLKTILDHKNQHYMHLNNQSKDNKKSCEDENIGEYRRLPYNIGEK